MNSNSYTHDTGVVIKKDLGIYTVKTSSGVFHCTLSSGLLNEADYGSSHGRTDHRDTPRNSGGLVAVGDNVRFDSGQGRCSIREVLPRRNQLTRQDPAPGNHKFEQVMVANVDVLVPVFAAAHPTPKWGLLDRYLVSAENAGIPVLILITKMDLVKNDEEALQELSSVVKMYQGIGYTVVLTSSLTGVGLEEVRRQLEGRLAAFVGKSGVGKSALLNALEPGLTLRTGAVSQGKVGKGKHTTTSAELIQLTSGSNIIDTPGVREFGLYGLDGGDLAFLFPEMRPYLGRCKFGLDCHHDEEPGCAIRRAVMDGKISPYRYRNFLLLQEEL